MLNPKPSNTWVWVSSAFSGVDGTSVGVGTGVAVGIGDGVGIGVGEGSEEDPQAAMTRDAVINPPRNKKVGGLKTFMLVNSRNPELASLTDNHWPFR